jgi:hypothetical protein
MARMKTGSQRQRGTVGLDIKVRGTLSSLYATTLHPNTLLSPLLSNTLKLFCSLRVRDKLYLVMQSVTSLVGWPVRRTVPGPAVPLKFIFPLSFSIRKIRSY